MGPKLTASARDPPWRDGGTLEEDPGDTDRALHQPGSGWIFLPLQAMRSDEMGSDGEACKGREDIQIGVCRGDRGEREEPGCLLLPDSRSFLPDRQDHVPTIILIPSKFTKDENPLSLSLSLSLAFSLYYLYPSFDSFCCFNSDAPAALIQEEVRAPP